MATYGEYCPVAKGAEILTERWTPLIVLRLLWGIRRFNDLERNLPGISRALLAARLRRLQKAGIVERRTLRQSVEYHLTPAGEDLRPVIRALGAWGSRWMMGRPKARELSPLVLLWAMRRRINFDRLPKMQTVVQFDFRGAKKTTLWLVFQSEDVSICIDHPGAEPDLLITADLAAFFSVWRRQLPYREALARGLIAVDGPPALARAFPGWLKWSQFATL